MERAVGEELYRHRVLVSGSSTGRVLSTWRVRLALTRCRWFHRSISRPVKGKYRCWTCLKEFDTDF